MALRKVFFDDDVFDVDALVSAEVFEMPRSFQAVTKRSGFFWIKYDSDKDFRTDFPSPDWPLTQ
jgi:hypothetical protein